MTDALRPGLGIDALAVAITSELLPTARLLQDASTTPFWLDSPVLARLPGSGSTPRSLENFAALMAAAHPTLSPMSVIPYEADATRYEGDQIPLKSLRHRTARHHSMRAREFHLLVCAVLCCAVPRSVRCSP